MEAADALKLTSKDMLKNKLIDGVIKEPMGGAHVDPATMFETVKKEILANIEELDGKASKDRISNRIKKFDAMGTFKK